MRILSSWMFLAVTAIVGIARADVSTVPVDDKAALEWYKNSQLVVSKATVNPFELAGCLVLHKEGKIDQYVNILPESFKKTLKPQNLTDSVYRTMLTREQAVKVGFLGFLGVSSSEKSLLEVSINERWKLEGPSFWGDNELKKVVLEVGKIYALQGYQVSYNQNIQYSTLVTSEFQENSGNVKSAFTYVDAGGKRFVQSSSYAQRELISIAPLDITPILATWNPDTTAVSHLMISKQQIESLLSNSASYTNKAIQLNSADLAVLRANSARITSVDFKRQLLQ